MIHSKLILIRAIFSLVCLSLSASGFTAESLRLTDGLNLSTDRITLGDQFRVQFLLRESDNVAVSSARVQVVIANARGGSYKVVSDFRSVNFEAGETKSLSQQYSIVKDLDLQPGHYVFAVGYIGPNGDLKIIDDEGNANNRVKVTVSRTLLGYEGYIYGRTDEDEYRWVGRLPDGEFGHTWMDRECARLFGAAHQTGDWFQLTTYNAPAGNHIIDNPCSAGLVNPNNAKLSSGLSVYPPSPRIDEQFEVTFTLRETESRPVTFSNVQVSIENADNSATFNLGNTKLEAGAGASLRASFGPNLQLPAGDYRIVVRGQLFDGPLTNFETIDEGSNSTELQIRSSLSGLDFNSDTGTESYVYARTDANELRWVSQTPSGLRGHIWIDEQCAESLGGVNRRGTWEDLAILAPAGDQTISYPCGDTSVDEVADILFVNDGQGYVFGRSDAPEFRWIATTPSGEFGHTWISIDCARALGGSGISGDWNRLNKLAPAGDQTISNPCDAISSFLHGSDGYVFARTDAPEYRWIARAGGREFGHIWIDEQCAEALGGVKARGNWHDLKARATAGDMSVDNPC